jgi:hypothetical protein
MKETPPIIDVEWEVVEPPHRDTAPRRAPKLRRQWRIVFKIPPFFGGYPMQPSADDLEVLWWFTKLYVKFFLGILAFGLFFSTLGRFHG